jgi:hypothetical protein
MPLLQMRRFTTLHELAITAAVLAFAGIAVLLGATLVLGMVDGLRASFSDVFSHPWSYGAAMMFVAYGIHMYLGEDPVARRAVFRLSVTLVLAGTAILGVITAAGGDPSARSAGYVLSMSGVAFLWSVGMAAGRRGAATLNR